MSDAPIFFTKSYQEVLGRVEKKWRFCRVLTCIRCYLYPTPTATIDQVPYVSRLEVCVCERPISGRR